MLANELMAIWPELLVAIGGIVLLMYGVFAGNQATARVVWASAGVLVLAFALVFFDQTEAKTIFADMFILNGYVSFMKALVLLASIGGLLISLRYLERADIAKFEFPVLYLFATLGMLMMISANDLISLYIGLELQSLALYVVAAFRRDTLRSTEAGLKYFVLGALSSGMLLYGASMVYGFIGSTNFTTIASTISSDPAAVMDNLGLTLGLVFVAAGLAFKVSAVPFHMWTPDVYEGAPLPVTAFFSTAPKLAAMALFIRVMMEPFGGLFDQWQQIVVLVSVASMALGTFAALYQKRIKRLMAYSSIGHVGFAFVGLAAGTEKGVAALTLYLCLYLAMSLGFFACLLSLTKNEHQVEDLSQFAGLNQAHPFLAASMSIFLISMAGIPPLAGFFSKLYVFEAAVDAGLVWLVVVGLILSVFSAFYYFRLVKIMYFDEPVEGVVAVKGFELKLVIVVCLVVVVAFIAWPDLILAPVSDATSLFASAGAI